MARLTLALLGGFRAQLSSGNSLTLTSKKAQALLAYLGVRQGQRISRDTVATLLWGDTGEAQARQSLRQTLVSLRQALPRTKPALLLTDNETLALNDSGVDVDVRVFERLASKPAPDALGQALTLFNGDLLEGFRVREAHFEDWLRGERERLRGHVVGALERLSTQRAQSEALEVAIQAGLRLLVLDPLQESVHRSLMRLYLHCGRRAAALKQYQVCVDVLQRELGVQPDPATKTLYQHALSCTTPTATVLAYPAHDTRPMHLASGAGLLIGRQPELGQLHLALNEAWKGRGQLVTILGEAGIGKSRLIQELAARAEDRGGQVIVGRCFESEQVLPFAPWVDLLRSEEMRPTLNEVTEADARHRTQLARLLPELGRGGLEPPAPTEDCLRIFGAVTQVVKAVAARQPTVVILEDVHWADDMSVRLLMFLARRCEAWPLLLVASARVEELDSPLTRRLLAEVDGAAVVRPVTLAPLSEEETLTLVKHLASAHARQDVVECLGKRLWRLSEGNPFMVVETMRAQHEGTSPEAVDRLPLAKRIEQVITRRLERLGGRGQELVAVAAVIGREFEYALLRRAAAVSERSAAAGVEELVRHRVFHSVGERIGFTHDRIREVAYERLLVSRRRLLHGRVARALEKAYAQNLELHSGALGLHYREAGLFAKAAVHLRQAAAGAAAQGAHWEAVAYLDQALVALDRLPKHRDTLEQGIDLRFDLWNSLSALAQFKRVFTCLSEAEHGAATLDDQPRLGWASAYLGYYFWFEGHPVEACAYAQRARAIGEEHGDVPLTVNANKCLGLAHAIMGEYRQAEAYLEKGVTLLVGDLSGQRCGLQLYPSVTCRSWLAWACAERGEFDRGLAHGQEAVRLAEALDHPFSASIACWCLGFLYEARGLRSEAIRLLERSLSLAHDWHIDVISPLVKASLGSVYAASGRVEDGLSLLQQGLDSFKPDRVFHAHATVLQSRTYLLASRVEDALSAARRAVALARNGKERGTEAWALRLLGDIASRPDSRETELAVEHYRHSLAVADELDMRPLVAHCHLGLGELYRRASKRLQAQEHLTTATTMYREMGMNFWLEKAEAALGSPPRNSP